MNNEREETASVGIFATGGFFMAIWTFTLSNHIIPSTSFIRAFAGLCRDCLRILDYLRVFSLFTIAGYSLFQIIYVPAHVELYMTPHVRVQKIYGGVEMKTIDLGTIHVGLLVVLLVILFCVLIWLLTLLKNDGAQKGKSLRFTHVKDSEKLIVKANTDYTTTCESKKEFEVMYTNGNISKSEESGKKFTLSFGTNVRDFPGEYPAILYVLFGEIDITYQSIRDLRITRSQQDVEDVKFIKMNKTMAEAIFVN
jgi:hypothetical protein